jgi:hypothetical protein
MAGSRYGNVFYEAITVTGQNYDSIVVYSTPAGEWYRLDNRVRGISAGNGTLHPWIDMNGDTVEERMQAFWTPLYLDTGGFRAVIGNNYKVSPNRTGPVCFCRWR